MVLGLFTTASLSKE